jgi:urease accessory protein
LVITPNNSTEVAAICYEIGNKHIPLFIEHNLLLVPFEQPLFTLLLAQGYKVKQQQAKLLQPIKTTVTPHAIDTSNMFFKAI